MTELLLDWVEELLLHVREGFPWLVAPLLGQQHVVEFFPELPMFVEIEDDGFSMARIVEM